MEQAAQNAAHEQHGNEHRCQRQRHRQNRETDFARAVERRLHRRFSLFHVTHDVLEHHDRVVHDESHRQCQRHQREIVEAVAHQVHHRERADDRERQRETRDDGRRQILEEQEDHHHYERQGDEQRELDVVHGLPDRDRAVVERVDFDGGGDLRAERCDRGLHAVSNLHRVRARLTLNGQHDGALAVVPARVARVLDVVQHIGDILEPHRGTVLVRDSQLAEFGGARDRAVGEHGVRALRAPQRPGRQIWIAR